MIGTRARTPDYCATGITGESKHDLQAPAARARVCFDLICRHPRTRPRCRGVVAARWDATGTEKLRLLNAEVGASRVASGERRVWRLIRSRAPSIVVFGGRADR